MPSAWDVVYPDPDQADAEVRIGPWPSRSAAQHLARAVAGTIEPHDDACEAVAARRVHARRGAPIETPAQLRAWMARHGHTADTLARALQMSRAGVYHWLAGARRLPPTLGLTLAALARRRA